MERIWTDKYAPQKLMEVEGNRKSKEDFVGWATAFGKGSPPWCLISGPRGTGKTSLVHAFARENGYDLFEVNRENLGDSVTLDGVREAMFNTTTLVQSGPTKRMILVDEIDVLASAKIGSRSSENGHEHIADDENVSTSVLLKTLTDTRVPVVFTLSDEDELYRNKKLILLKEKKLCAHIKLTRVRSDTIRLVLKKIAKAERLDISDEVLTKLAEGAEGDVRAAVNDLQAIGVGEEVVTSADLGALGRRQTAAGGYKTVLDVILSPSIQTALDKLTSSTEDSETIFAWMVENLPGSRSPPTAIYASCNQLAESSLFGFRAKRYRMYGLQKYMNELMCYSPQLLGERRYMRLNFPSRLRYLSRSRAERARTNLLAGVFSKYLHSSPRAVLNSDLQLITGLAQGNDAFKEWLRRKFGEEVSELLLAT